VTGGGAIVADSRHALSRSYPFTVPLVKAAITDSLDGGRALTEIGAAISRLEQRALAERLVHRIFAEQVHRFSLPS
jgi:hypothetical protein